MKAAGANESELARGDVARCVEPGVELGLEKGQEYEVVRVVDRITVAVRSLAAVTVHPDHMLDTWQHATWPDQETLTPRMAGRFSLGVISS